MSQYSFNAREVAPDPGVGDPIPDGWYPLVILKAPEFGPNSKQNGTAISAQFSVADGPYKGRIIFHNFNVDNPSEKATNIGRGQLSALSYALNVLSWTDTSQLVNIVFLGKVAIEPASDGYPAKNKINAFKHVNDPSAGKPNMTAPQAARPVAPPPAAPAYAPPPQAAAPAYAPAYAPPPQAPVAPPAWTPPPSAAPAPAAPPAQPPAWTPPAAPQAWEQPQQAPQAAPAPAPAYAPPPQPMAPAPAQPPAYAPPQAPVGDAPPPWAQPQQ